MLEIRTAEFRPVTQWKTPTGYALEFTTEGNLELRDPRGNLVWESQTGGKGADMLAMQADGNLVIYRETTPVWATNTERNPDAVLVMLDSGDIQVWAPDGRRLWSAGSKEVEIPAAKSRNGA